MQNLYVALCSIPEGYSKKLAMLLLQEKVAACVKIHSGLKSYYRWEGEICQDDECYLIIKTTETNLEQLEQIIIDFHPYDVPEIIFIKGEKVSEKYLRWVNEVTN